MSEQSERGKAIFLDAIEEPSPERGPAVLEQACAGDTALRVEVERLLSARLEIGSFHETAAASTMTAAPPAGEAAGAMVGAYKLLQVIGEGGMGVVWLAEQTQPLRRNV